LGAQDTASSAKQPAASATKSGAPAARSGSGKGPLPDPVLLDGSTQPAEKKSETGMLGDFELPGDENARNNRVGGQQQQMPGQQGGQQGMQGLPQMGGGGAQGQPQQGQQPPPGAQAAGGGGPPPDGKEQQQQGGGAPGGPNDPNAKAEGQQVAGGLEADPNGAGGEGGAEAGQKPQQVAIGDRAMQIKGVNNAAGVVGAQVPAGQTQQMEKNVGGGKGSSSVSGGRNSAEKGRAMPSGL